MAEIYNKDLPDGYIFGDRANILPEEIIHLRESVGWFEDTQERWSDILSHTLHIVVVRDESNDLVGAAFIAGNLRHAVLCDLAVKPEHQHNGIGDAIMGRLEDTIQNLGIKYIYAELAETNPFRDKMIQSGFKETGASLFREQ